jgi:lipooligosaccharide transport system permease protein
MIGARRLAEVADLWRVPDVSHRALHVWRRNLDTFVRLWKTELWPPFIEPLLFLLALGYGLGAYVLPIEGQDYVRFIAPGIFAQTAMFSASFECLYGSFIRMEHQKTFDAIIATPASIDDVITGEILWGTTRGLASGVAVLLIAGALGMWSSPLAPLALVVIAAGSFAFASLAMVFTSVSPSINFFNYAYTLVLAPMFLFSGVFFPLNRLPEIAQRIAWFAPLTHMTIPSRELFGGQLEMVVIWDTLWLLVVGLIAYYFALQLMRRRLIK